MGKIQDALKNTALTSEMKEQLTFLKKAAETKLKLFKSELDNMFLNPDAHSTISVVGNRALRYYEEYRVNVSQDIDGALTGIVDEFFTFSKQGTKNGFQNIIKAGLKTILGSAQIGEHETHKMFVVPENNAFVRVDVKIWRYNFSNDSVIGTTENAFCFLFSKSIIDHKTLILDELVYLISEMHGGDLDKVSEYVDDLKELWEKLSTITGRAVAANYVNAIDENIALV